MVEISVIVPTYNRIELLEKTLVSLCHQTLMAQSFEVIVIDDGGTDDSDRLCERFSNRLDIRYFRQADKGFRVSKARNIGIAAAEGKYILFIDSGILVHQEVLSRHLAWHRGSVQPLVCIGYIYGFLMPEEVTRKVLRHLTPDDVAASAALLEKHQAWDPRKAQYDELGFNISTWPAPFDLFWGGHVSAERSEIIKAGLFDESFVSWGGEDVDLGVRLFLANNKFITSTELISIHWPHDRSVINYSDQTETAAARIHQKHQLWQTAFYHHELYNEHHELNKVIHLHSELKPFTHSPQA